MVPTAPTNDSELSKHDASLKKLIERRRPEVKGGVGRHSHVSSRMHRSLRHRGDEAQCAVVLWAEVGGSGGTGGFEWRDGGVVLLAWQIAGKRRKGGCVYRTVVCAASVTPQSDHKAPREGSHVGVRTLNVTRQFPYLNLVTTGLPEWVFGVWYGPNAASMLQPFPPPHTRSQSGTQSRPGESGTLGRQHHCDRAHRMPRCSSSSTSVAIILRRLHACSGMGAVSVRGAACHPNIV
ncbi:hypothetical protein JB92DRAFT_2831988 [Gautieria morchelliformis]|nr:hypothetical protein JB92DRAFT_2831988 [Gautieria morchelliformis]